MGSYLYLLSAIVLEVCGTILLPISHNFTKILPTTLIVVCNLGALYFITFAIRTIPLSIVYATWSGLGVLLIAVLGWLIYHQALRWQAITGMGLIILGVILVNLFSSVRPLS